MIKKFKKINKKFKHALVLSTVAAVASVACLCGLGHDYYGGYEAVSAPAINWGLKPNTLEQIPVAPDGIESLLAQYGGMYHANTQDKRAYLTFDLGYEAGYTAQVLDILKANNLKAVFFLCGNYLKEVDLINRMLKEGHMIGNHTDKHKKLPTLSDEALKTDIMTFQDDFMAQFPNAAAPVFFRPPSGTFCERTLKIAHENNLRTMMWSLATVDWGKTAIDAVNISNLLSSRVHPGAIILLHISNSGTPPMLEQLLAKIGEKGYTVGNPSELLDISKIS